MQPGTIPPWAPAARVRAGSQFPPRALTAAPSWLRTCPLRVGTRCARKSRCAPAGAASFHGRATRPAPRPSLICPAAQGRRAQLGTDAFDHSDCEPQQCLEGTQARQFWRHKRQNIRSDLS